MDKKETEIADAKRRAERINRSAGQHKLALARAAAAIVAQRHAALRRPL